MVSKNRRSMETKREGERYRQSRRGREREIESKGHNYTPTESLARPRDLSLNLPGPVWSK